MSSWLNGMGRQAGRQLLTNNWYGGGTGEKREHELSKNQQREDDIDPKLTDHSTCPLATSLALYSRLSWPPADALTMKVTRRESSAVHELLKIINVPPPNTHTYTISR